MYVVRDLDITLNYIFMLQLFQTGERVVRKERDSMFWF